MTHPKRSWKLPAVVASAVTIGVLVALPSGADGHTGRRPVGIEPVDNPVPVVGIEPLDDPILGGCCF